MVKLVGILNVTPDSFSDGGQFLDPSAAIAQAQQLFADGASLVDVGAESTRPNATPLTDKEEWRRLEPVLRQLIPAYPGKISLDSYHPATFEKAFTIGPVIINDVTGFNDPALVAIAEQFKPTVIVSHLPKMSLQAAHQLAPVSAVAEVTADLLRTATLLQSHGLSRQQIILDPGIGFGKTMALNQELLCFAEEVPDYQVMIGYSRKRFLGERRMELEPNLEAGRIAISHGAAYLRVHDIAGHHTLLAN